MGRKSKNEESLDLTNCFICPSRISVPVPFYELKDQFVTEQGQEKTVRQLYEDFVLGRLDVRDLGGKAQYDPDDSDVVDPMNCFGMTLEETSQIADAGHSAYNEVKSKQLEKQKQEREQAIAKAKADAIEEAKRQLLEEQRTTKNENK